MADDGIDFAELAGNDRIGAALAEANEALGQRVVELEREINLIDRLLARRGLRREHGHHGARGVAWLGERYDGALEELVDTDRELKTSEVERDGLRRKLDAVRALCELDDRELRNTVGSYAIDLAVELRKILDGEE